MASRKNIKKKENIPVQGGYKGKREREKEKEYSSAMGLVPTTVSSSLSRPMSTTSSDDKHWRLLPAPVPRCFYPRL